VLWGDWLICGRVGDAGVWGVGAGFGVGVDLGVLNAPVDARCRRSNSSCSLGGSRGGEGPVAKAGLKEVVVKSLRDGRRNFGGNSRDIVMNYREL